MSLPITPAEVSRLRSLPSFVIDAVNELILENYIPDMAFIIKHVDFVNRVMEKMPANQTWNPVYFDIERTFGERGWIVTSDSIEGVYTFKAKL